MATTGIPTSLLPKKESENFQKILKMYEQKDYRKALKTADALLKKFPTHGETLAMRGLTIFYLPDQFDKSLAYIEVKKAIRYNMRSHICWHVFGLLYRADRVYDESIKCYKQALKFDAGNNQILRDLSLLQITTRHYTGFMETRKLLLDLKPGLRFNWIAFAFAKHLNGEHGLAVSIIDTYVAQVNTPGGLQGGEGPREEEYGRSELEMYKSFIMRESAISETLNPTIEDKGIEKAEVVIKNKDGTVQSRAVKTFTFDECVTHLQDMLTEAPKVVLDVSAVLFTLGETQLFSGLCSDAIETFMSMFKRGQTEDYRVHCLYQCALLELTLVECMGYAKGRGMDTVASTTVLTPAQCELLLSAYSKLSIEHPLSAALKRIPLTILKGAAFTSALTPYIGKSLKKGVPSLGADLSSFFTVISDGKITRAKDPVDVLACDVFDVVLSMNSANIEALNSDAPHFPNDDFTSHVPVPEETLCWAYYLQSGLHEISGSFELAHEAIDSAIKLYPTIVDLYERKARLLKLSGDVVSAATTLDNARKLDLQDRYINNKTTKYLLRAGSEEQAEATIGLFTKHERNLEEMQCSWFSIEYGALMLSKQAVGLALKKFNAVSQHFTDYNDDQFDFHNYCVRKMTLRAYVSILRYENHIWGHDYYIKAANGLVSCYLHLFEHGYDDGEGKDKDRFDGLSGDARKKAKAQERKKKKKEDDKKKEEEELVEKEKEKQKIKVEAAAAAGDKKDDKDKGEREGEEKVEPYIDPDPTGSVLCKLPPLAEALKYSTSLTIHAPLDVNTWILHYDVKSKDMSVPDAATVCISALKSALELDSDNAHVFYRVVDLSFKAPSQVKSIIGKDATIQSYVTTRASEVKASSKSGGVALVWRISIARAMKVTGLEGAADVIIDGGVYTRGCYKLKDLVVAMGVLKELGDEGTVAVWKGLCRGRFPRALAFME